MTLSTEQLKEIEELAANLMKRSEIAIILGLDSTLFAKASKKPGTDVFNAFQRGYLITKSKIKKSIVSHATAGSSPAQTLSEKFFTEIEMEELDD